MCLQEKVSEEHVQEALRLFEVSTIDRALRAPRRWWCSPEQREELTLVETQIKQKLAIGAGASRHGGGPRAAGRERVGGMRAPMIMSQRRSRNARRAGARDARALTTD